MHCINGADTLQPQVQAMHVQLQIQHHIVEVTLLIGAQEIHPPIYHKMPKSCCDQLITQTENLN